MPTVVPTDSRPLSCPPIGALPRNRLASSATGSASSISPTARFAVPLVTPSVGADAHIGPPDLVPHFLSPCHCETSDRCHWLWQSAPPCKKHVIARPVRKLVVAIRAPVPSAPLPKGGWHGEAVTGGFLSRASCNPSVGATLAVARGRGRAPPLRTAKYASVGRAALSPPPVNHRTITAA